MPGGRSTTNVRSISGGQYTVSREDTCFLFESRSDPPAAVPFDQLVRYNDLCGRKARIFDMTDHLRGCFHSKLPGVNINGGQLRRSQSAKSELLKERMDRSSGMEISASIQILSRESARISSLTSTAVGRSSLKSSFRSS